MKNLLFLLVALLLLGSCSDDEGEIIPTLTTTAVTGINSVEATAGGNITGNSTLIAKGVVWSANTNPTIDLDTKTNDGIETGTFTSHITGLQPYTNYYVRAYATTKTGTIYGNEVQFATGAAKLYICGTEWNTELGIQQCKVWIDGIPAFWGVEHETIGQALFVSGTDVYVAGSTKQNNFRATYWKNGVPTYLTEDKEEAVAHSIVIKGNDVYVSGYEKNTASIKVAKYWKNGVAVTLTDGTHDAEGRSIFVSGNDVYVSGYETGVFNTHIWKNGVRMSIDGIKGIDITSVYVSGNDLHATSDNLYWKNGVGVIPSTGYKLQSMTLFGEDVYLVGESTLGIGAYWKNGEMMMLDPYGSYAKSIFVSGSDVYTVGKAENNIVYWKNGSATVISANANDHNNGMGIVFK